MKKVLAFIAALTLAVSVTACGDKIRQENQSRDQTGSDTSSDTQSASPGGSDNENSEPEPEPLDWYRSDGDGFKELINIFDMDDIEAPDGEILKKADADYLYGNSEQVFCAGYDFSYMRKVRPYFRNTFDEPDMINWETLEVSDKREQEIVPSSEYFKIKMGDVLENGLTVKTAQTAFGCGLNGTLFDLKIELDGEITIEGIIECVPEDEYTVGKGALLFYPDSTKQSDIFSPYQDYGRYPYTFVDSEKKFAMVCDGVDLFLGSVYEVSSSVSDLFANDTYIKAKVTLSDIQFRTTPAGVSGSAVIKNAVKL